MNAEPTAMTNTVASEIPDESWSFDRLAAFCGLMCRRLAEDAWLIGRAFHAVKAKLKHGRWLPWVREHCPGVSRGTANRYMLLAERLTLDEVRGHGLTECYRRAGILNPPQDDSAPRLPTTRTEGRRGQAPTETTATTWESGWPSWAVHDPFAPALDAGGAVPGEGNEDPSDCEALTEADVFREEWEAHLPRLLAEADDTLGWLLDRWDALGPPAGGDRLAQPIRAVGDKLAVIAARLGCPGGPGAADPRREDATPAALAV